LYGIVYSASRDDHPKSILLTGLMYTAAAVFAGALTGGALALLGSVAPQRVLMIAGGSVAAVGGAIGLIEVAGIRIRPWQFDRETPQHWVHKGPIYWALWNGVTLGVGASSRIGFWLWYVIPLAAFASGTLSHGAMIYGSYGFTRAGAAVGLLGLQALSRGRIDVASRLLRLAKPARLIAAAQLIMISVAVWYAWWR